MNKAIGVTIIALGILAGAYAGFWWAFVGGIIDVIEEVRAPNLEAMGVAIGILKVICAGLIFQLVAIPMVYFGFKAYTGE